jgi:hypothetical protein
MGNDAADAIVTCVAKNADGDIVEVLVGEGDGAEWQSADEAIQAIDGGATYRVLNDSGPEVHVVDDPDGKYLRSDPDDTSGNNLDNLNETNCRCGPDVTEWFIEELQRHYEAVEEQFEEVFEGPLPDPAGSAVVGNMVHLLVEMLNYAIYLRYKDMTFSEGDCPSAVSHCDETVTLGGRCVHRSELGNIMFGYVFHTFFRPLGFTFVVEGGVMAEDWADEGIDTEEDAAGVTLGANLAEQTGFSNPGTPSSAEFRERLRADHGFDTAAVSEELDGWFLDSVPYSIRDKQALVDGVTDPLSVASRKGCHPCETPTAKDPTEPKKFFDPSTEDGVMPPGPALSDVASRKLQNYYDGIRDYLGGYYDAFVDYFSSYF